jgi:hypothetical protein
MWIIEMSQNERQWNSIYRGCWKVMDAKDDAGVGEFRVGKKTRIAIACAPGLQLRVDSANPPLSFFLVQYRPCQDAARLTLNFAYSLFPAVHRLSFLWLDLDPRTIEGRRRYVDRIQL